MLKRLHKGKIIPQPNGYFGPCFTFSIEQHACPFEFEVEHQQEVCLSPLSLIYKL